MEKNISFGTSGHRGIIGKTFTAQHIRAIAKAVSDYFHSQNFSRIALGFDPRSGNSPLLEEGSFTKILCDVFISEGINVDLFDDFASTPLISWYIKNKNLPGGIILTASHNPKEYNGIKFNAHGGAPASTEVTKIIEDSANKYFDQEIILNDQPSGQINKININQEFTQSLILNIQNNCGFCKLDFSDVAVAIDAKHGTVSSLWVEIFKNLSISKYEILNAAPMSDFGGIEPNPTKLHTLSGLREKQKEMHAPIAIANDPDGDRHVILDENGELVSPELVMMIIFDYLVQKGVNLLGIASTVASSGILKSACEKNNLEYFETPVGFKYFAPFLEKAASQNKIGLAVESSGGFTASFHVLEKCGFLPGVWLLYILKDTNQSLSELKKQVQEKYGKLFFLEEEYHFQPEKKAELVKLFQAFEKADLGKITKEECSQIIKIDGLKIVFQNAWMLMRLSGTEPLARIYTESNSIEVAQDYLNLAKNILK